MVNVDWTGIGSIFCPSLLTVVRGANCTFPAPGVWTKHMPRWVLAQVVPLAPRGLSLWLKESPWQIHVHSRYELEKPWNVVHSTSCKDRLHFPDQSHLDVELSSFVY